MIDNVLMKEAMTLSGIKTKRDIVHRALEEFVRNLKKRICEKSGPRSDSRKTMIIRK